MPEVAVVRIEAVYQGQLRCSVTHGPSGTNLITDAPVDNMGKGEAFSPTDLVATALGTCVLTTMAIVAKRNGIELGRAEVVVTKEMTATGPRRIARLTVTVTVHDVLPDEHRRRLEAAAHAYPVHQSLHPDVEVPLTIHWGGQA